MIEYDQEMPQAQTAGQPMHVTVRKGHKVGIVQALTENIGIFQVPFPFNVNKLCSDKTKICLDIGPALLVS